MFKCDLHGCKGIHQQLRWETDAELRVRFTKRYNFLHNETYEIRIKHSINVAYKIEHSVGDELDKLLATYYCSYNIKREQVKI